MHLNYAKVISDERGSLIPIEFSMIPFEVKHAFVIEGKPSLLRGGHAHLAAKQMLFCVEGNVQASVSSLNGNSNVAELRVDRHAASCLFVPEKNWLDLKFGPMGGRILVCSDMPYSETDYIRDIDSFFGLGI